MRVKFWRVTLAGLLTMTFVLVGCGGKKEGLVSGKVTYKGQALTTGTINFMDSAKGAAAQASLDSTGAFKFQEPIPAGTYKVYFQPPLPEQLPPGQAPKKAGPYPLPPKYQDPAQTTITKEVKVGNNDIPIEVPD